MRLIKSLVRWIDKDWEGRRYNPVFAFAQRLVWCVPILLIGMTGHLAGAKPGDFLYDWGLPIGMFLSLSLFGLSSYRWFRGYGRTDWQETQARKRSHDRSGR